MNALDLISRSLRLANVIAEGETPSAAAGADALAALNAMLAEWEIKGIRLGLPTLTLSSTIPLPASHENPIVYSLAAMLAAEYGAPLNPTLAAMADAGMSAMATMYVRPPELAPLPELYWCGTRRRGW
jgi:hypothetical protein